MICVSPIKLNEFRFIGDGMHEALYTHRGRRSVIQSDFEKFLIIGEELYIGCTIFGDRELMVVESFSTGFNTENHVVEPYTTLVGFPIYTN